MKYIPRILPYLRPYWALGAVSGTVMVLASLFSLAAPWPITVLVDNVLGTQPVVPALQGTLGPLAADKTALLVFVVMAGLLITFMSGALDVLSNYVNTKLEQRI